VVVPREYESQDVRPARPAGDRQGRDPRSQPLSDFEDAAREFLARRARTAREARDLAILDGSAAGLNEEMEDVLAYQADA
jgi:hypothetical protein